MKKRYNWINKGTFSAADINGVYVEKSLSKYEMVYTAFFTSRLNGRTTPLEANTWIGMRDLIHAYKKVGTRFLGSVVDGDTINREVV